MYRGLTAWKPSAADWNRAAAAHLLRRVGFGWEPGGLERAVDAGYEATVDDVLTRDESDQELRRGVRAVLALDDVEQLAAWWMALILADGAPLRERVALMWHDHFATSNDKVDDVRLMHRQNELFRSAGLGDFRALLHAIAKDPAMLVWLDGNDNRRGQANENFAREVMELFGLGIGNYAEQDVLEAARAFTGWGTKGRSFENREFHHDPGTKTILGKSGAFRGEDVVELILAQPACSRHIARRLLEEFVAPAPAAELVDETARELVAADWNVGTTIERIVRSEAFWSHDARRARIAGPVELVARTARALGARIAPAAAAVAALEMGQSLFRPPSVKGWDGGRTWINAGTWLARHNTATKLASAHGSNEGTARVDLAAAFGSPVRVTEIPGRVATALLPDVDDAGLRASLAESAETADSLDDALVRVTALVLTSPEYQLV